MSRGRGEGPASRSAEVPEGLEGQRLDRGVRELFEVSWGEARRWIDRGKIFVDGGAVTDQGAALRASQRLELRLEAPRPALVLDDRIVHLDHHLVVLRKPAGISTVPHDEQQRGTVIGELRRYLSKRQAARRRRGALPPVHVVQRLDRETSGLLVMARDRRTAEGLRVQFRAHEVHRRYLAIVAGRLAVDTLTYRSHLVEDRGDGRRGSKERVGWSHVRKQTGKLAVTHVEVVERFPRPPSTLLRCRLETGRTHQIRIHLSEAGHPLAGERRYLKGYQGAVVEAPRLMLHAAELGFTHPGTGAVLRFTEPVPDDMAAVLESLRAAAGAECATLEPWPGGDRGGSSET